jgi:hypothetical protein
MERTLNNAGEVLHVSKWKKIYIEENYEKHLI